MSDPSEVMVQSVAKGAKKVMQEAYKSIATAWTPSNIISSVIEQAVGEMSTTAKMNLAELQEDAIRSRIEMEKLQNIARAEQEAAIARRIDNADEVTIEEYYDVSGKGNVGLTADAKTETLALGVAAEGRRITKRVYTFKGWRTAPGIADGQEKPS